MEIRRFKKDDAKQIITLICRNLMEVNIKDYSLAEMERLVSVFTPEYIKERAKKGHMYVACEQEKIVGTATISDYYGSLTESIILSVFVLPEFHNKSVGRELIKALEKDDLAMKAKRIEVPASISAYRFYEKCGHQYKNGIKQLDDEGYYRMEKWKVTNYD